MTADLFARHTDLHLTGGPLRVYEAGPDDAPAVLLLHGAMLDSAPLIWRHMMPALAEDWRVIAPDLPRHGGSRPWPGSLGQPRLETVVDELLDRLGIARAALVGLSMGGGLAIGYALTRPERVRALVAVNPGGLDDVRPFQFLTWLFLRSGPLLRWSMKWVAAPAYLRRSMIKSFAHGEDTRDFEELMALVEVEARARVEHRERSLDDWQITAYGPRRMRLNHTPHLHRLAMPSLWVYGRADTAVDAQVMRRAADLAPFARLETVDGAGHLAPLDQPEHMNRLIAAFLTETG